MSKIKIPSISITMVLLFLSLSVLSSTPEYSRQKLIETSSTCLDCHEGYDETLSGSAHQLSKESEIKSQVAVGCIACHDGWEEHLEDPSKENIAVPSDYLLTAQADLCKRCHLTPHQAKMAAMDIHFTADVRCLNCHKIHVNSDEDAKGNNAAVNCTECHAEVAGEFKRRSAHPFQEGNIDCIDCHNFSGIKGAGQAAGLDWSCQECHSEYAGPFLYEHPVVYNHLVEGGGCMECHEPHGSPHDRLLRQPGNTLCQQCHGTPPGHRTNHSGLGTKFACVECHSDMHGSYDNNKLLDALLGVRLFPDCYQSGCHIFDN